MPGLVLARLLTRHSVKPPPARSGPLSHRQAKQARAFGRKAGAGFATNTVNQRRQMDPDTLELLVRRPPPAPAPVAHAPLAH